MSALPRLLTLEEWAAATYETPPALFTLRKWAREQKINPAPKKHGRTYYVSQDARYMGYSDAGRLAGRIRGKAA